jgi:hypothetical protein
VRCFVRTVPGGAVSLWGKIVVLYARASSKSASTLAWPFLPDGDKRCAAVRGTNLQAVERAITAQGMSDDLCTRFL